MSELDGQLSNFGYSTKHIRISDLIEEESSKLDELEPISNDPELAHKRNEYDRITSLMNKGDEICENNSHAATLAFLSISQIQAERAESNRDKKNESTNRDRSDDTCEKCRKLSIHEPVPRTAYIIDSIKKRYEEVTHFRDIYGDRYIQIGLQSSDEQRKNNLETDMKSSKYSLNVDDLNKMVKDLMGRDLRESGVYGQKVSKVFPVSDFFINVDENLGPELSRFLNLLFNSPDFSKPTDAEFGMHLAFASSIRSPELGLKVGSAILAKDQVLALGVNAHPTQSDSPRFDHSASDIGALVLDTVKALSSELFTQEAQLDLERQPDLFVDKLLSGALSSAKIKDITEFQVPVHAEMSALLALLRRGVTWDGLARDDITMYVTAYPCHGCAKHLLALDCKVVYLEPYPKSRASAMYGESSIANFTPFTGIAPMRYESIFKIVSEKRKRQDGVRATWRRAEKGAAQPKVNMHIDQAGITLREVAALTRLPQKTQY